MNKQGGYSSKLTLAIMANKINPKLEDCFLMYHLNPQYTIKPIKRQAKNLTKYVPRFEFLLGALVFFLAVNWICYGTLGLLL
jgi:hypothetical protein